MVAPSPFAKLQEDGYELEVVEQASANEHPFLRHAVPDDDTRHAAQPGDIVKLIFRYRDGVEAGGQTITGEHMWVRVTQSDGACILGRLDSTPQFTALLKPDDPVCFHPKHIVRLWSDDTKKA